MNTVQKLKVLMTVLFTINLIIGVGMVTRYLDVAALLDLPDTFNTSGGVVLIVTGVWGLLVPYLPKYRNK